LHGGFLKGLFRLPGTIWKLNRMMNRTKAEAAVFANEFVKETAPGFVEEGRQATATPLPPDNRELLALPGRWLDRPLIGFGREGLKATVFADFAWNTVFEMLKPRLGEERARAAVAELSFGARPVEGEDLPSAIQAFAFGRLTPAEFVEHYGHRAANEME